MLVHARVCVCASVSACVRHESVHFESVRAKKFHSSLMAFESMSFRAAVRSTNQSRGTTGWTPRNHAIRRAQVI